MINSDRIIKQKLKNIGSGILNGDTYQRSDFARSILNYPAMMVPSVQEPIIKELSTAFDGYLSLLDPFMGASNTLVTSMKYGMSVFGQDINPLSVLLSKVKTTYYESNELEEILKSILCEINSDNSKDIFTNFPTIDKWFLKNTQIILSKICRAISKVNSLSDRQFFWVALGEVIRLNSNDRTSTFKLHIRPLNEIENSKANIINSFKNICYRNIESISRYSELLKKQGYITNGKYSKMVDLEWADTKNEIKTGRTFNLLVTSPPYGDNHTTVTYGQFSYLPLQWIPTNDIDESIDINYLSNAQKIDSISLGGTIEKEDEILNKELFRKTKTLKKFMSQFDDDKRKKARKVTKFIKDLDVSIDNMLLKLRKEAFLVWTIGNRSVNNLEVQNDVILTELFHSRGISLFLDLEREISNKRMPGRNNFSKMMNKEKILIFKKTT